MPEKKLEIGIIGLGKFGLRMATTLVSLGHTVRCCHTSMEVVL